MLLLGLTGGIASGKSTFLRLFQERFEVDFFDSDACARDLLDRDPAIRQQVVRVLHPNAYHPDGTPNRELLRELVYRDAAKKQLLEGILHPVIRERWTTQARKAADAGRTFLVDLPLLFETGAESLFDRIITVGCSVALQLSRLEHHRRLSREISEKIIASQMPMEIKITGSHHVVWNEGSFETLTTQIDFLARFLHARSG